MTRKTTHARDSKPSPRRNFETYNSRETLDRSARLYRVTHKEKDIPEDIMYVLNQGITYTSREMDLID